MPATPITSRLLPSTGVSASPRPGGAYPATAWRPAEDHIAARTAPATATLREAAHEHASDMSAPVDISRRSALVAALLAHVSAADRDAAKTAIPAILDAAHSAGTSDPNRIGYLLATAQTESDFGANMTEKGHSVGWFNAVYGCEDGNRPGSNDGYAYRGRGYVQTTHAGRYAEMSRSLGLPDVRATARDPDGHAQLVPALVAHPEKLAEPKLAARALVIGVVRNLFTHNARAALDTTVPTGKKPGNVDFYHARGIVNGIVESQAQAIARHATVFAQVLDSYRHSVLGVAQTK